MPLSSTGLAVGEIPPLMKQAANYRNQLFFELVADFEIFRYQVTSFLCIKEGNDAIAYSYRDLNQTKWYNKLKRWLLKSIMQDDGQAQSDLDTDEQIVQHTAMLQELNKQIYVVVQQTKTEPDNADNNHV